METGKLSKSIILADAVAVAKMAVQFSIKNGLMPMAVHPETVLTPGLPFAGQGFTNGLLLPNRCRYYVKPFEKPKITRKFKSRVRHIFSVQTGN